MKFNYLIICCSVVCLSGLFSGCESFVDLTPPTMARQDQYYKTQADFTAAVNGAYGMLRAYYTDFWVLAEMPSDNTEHNGYTLGNAPMDCMTWLSNDGSVQNNWLRSYAAIARTNTILDRIDGITMDADLREQYKAEVKFIRALMYFNLVQFFGEVPLSVHEIQTEQEAYSLLRAPVEDVYAQIEKDLLDAANILPPVFKDNDMGRVTKGAAQGLLGKVYMTRKHYDKAIPVLESVIQSGNYNLLPDYEDVFLATNGNNREIVFAVQYTATGYGEGSNFCFTFAPWGSGTDIVSGYPIGANTGTLDLWNAFEDGDKRKDVAIAVYEPMNARYTRKFLDRPSANNEGNNDWPVLRYPDILLLYAEALNESGRTSDAEKPLNKVRLRAGLSDISGINRDEMRLIIEHERRVELCFEGHRWPDLIRTGRMVEVMTRYKEDYMNEFEVASYDVTSDKVLFPIPFREISLNPNLTQNKGYD